MDEEVIRGREAQRHIVDVAQEVSSRVRSTLGPLGFDNLLVDKMGEHLLTNDGATILKMQAFADPIARIIVEVAKAQEAKAFDGTTTCVILVAELLRLADLLIEKGIHPNDITKGYREGLKLALESAEKAAVIFDSPKEAAVRAATTALTGKTAGAYASKLVELCTEAAMTAKPDAIKIMAAPGNTEDSQVVKGAVIMKEPTMNGMPASTEGNILLIDEDLGPPITNVSINDPQKIAEVAEVQMRYILERLAFIDELDVKAVFCQKSIDSRAQQHFRKNGIMAYRQVRKSDMERLAKITGANITTDLAGVAVEDLGEGTVKHIDAKPNSYTTIEGVNTGAASIILYATTEQAASEIMRALDDATGVAWLVAQEPKMVSGAGAIQATMALDILKGNHTPLNSKAEAAKVQFAEALLLIPRTLAESAGMDIMDTMLELQKQPGAGVNALEAKVEKTDVLEPFTVIASAMQSAVENVVSLLRTDAIIKAKSFQENFANEMGYD
jgi:chaperonin GroEL (HSP60 family)